MWNLYIIYSTSLATSTMKYHVKDSKEQKEKRILKCIILSVICLGRKYVY